MPIRVLLNLHPKPDFDPSKPKKYKSSNLDLVAKLNTLSNCLAINDFRYLWLNGTHHQKLVLVYNANGLNAFVGTCDLDSQRIVARWCEIHLKLDGDTAGELYEVFHRRWSEHTAVLPRAGSVKSYLKPLTDLRLPPPRRSTCLTQTSTTYGNPRRANPFRPILHGGVPTQQYVLYPHRIDVTTKSLGNLSFLRPQSSAWATTSSSRRTRPRRR